MAYLSAFRTNHQQNKETHIKNEGTGCYGKDRGVTMSLSPGNIEQQGPERADTSVASGTSTAVPFIQKCPAMNMTHLQTSSAGMTLRAIFKKKNLIASSWLADGLFSPSVRSRSNSL